MEMIKRCVGLRSEGTSIFLGTLTAAARSGSVRRTPILPQDVGVNARPRRRTRPLLSSVECWGDSTPGARLFCSTFLCLHSFLVLIETLEWMSNSVIISYLMAAAGVAASAPPVLRHSPLTQQHNGKSMFFLPVRRRRRRQIDFCKEERGGGGVTGQKMATALGVRERCDSTATA